MYSTNGNYSEKFIILLAVLVLLAILFSSSLLPGVELDSVFSLFRKAMQWLLASLLSLFTV